MDPLELRASLKEKTLQLEVALEMGRPHAELIALYKELKELQYQLAFADLAPKIDTPLPA
jgi:hypothetical protein